MVYISGDGTICDKPPWNIGRIVKIFYGMVNFVVLFTPDEEINKKSRKLEQKEKEYNLLLLQPQDKLYSQIDGCAMGASISSVIAQLVMKDSEESIIESSDFNLPFFFRFVDDCITAAPENKIGFQTLVGLDSKPQASVKSGGNSYRSGDGGGGGGGGGRPFGPGGGGGGPKKFMTLRDVNPPTIGGCPGGACGR